MPQHGFRLRKRVVLGALALLIGVLIFGRRIADRGPSGFMQDLSLDDDPHSARAESIAVGRRVAEERCMRCHGPDMCGGLIEDSTREYSLASNLTRGGVGALLTEQEFLCVLREHRRLDGEPISTVMPAVLTKTLSDDTIRALWLFIQDLSPR